MTVYWLGALNQRTYPGAGDVDDCWVVATIWACRYQTHQSRNLPTVPEFRAAAGNPDDPRRADGGNHNQINRAVDRLWPTVPNKHYAARDWPTFAALIKAGASASVAASGRALPVNARFGFNGPHQIAIVYRGGDFYVMNPLQKNGAAPIRITESALKRAVLMLNGWVLGIVFPKINLGVVRKTALVSRAPRPFWKYKALPNKRYRRRAAATRGFSAVCVPPKIVSVNGRTKRMIFICTGGRAGWHIDKAQGGTTFTP